MDSDEITSGEVIKILGVTKVTLYAWCADVKQFPELKHQEKAFGKVTWKFFSRALVLKLKARMKKKRGLGESWVKP